MQKKALSCKCVILVIKCSKDLSHLVQIFKTMAQTTTPSWCTSVIFRSDFVMMVVVFELQAWKQSFFISFHSFVRNKVLPRLNEI